MSKAATSPPTPLQHKACYVRIRHARPDGFVEFDFSIGDPTLSVELILPMAAFQEFCRTQRAVKLSEEWAAAIDFDNAKWRFGAPGVTE